MATPKFHTANGWLTLYGLACGYIEQSDKDGINTTLWMEHGHFFHVRQHNHSEGKRVFWDVFETLGEARKRYSLAIREAA